MLYHLAPKGVMATVLANGSLSSNTSGEGDLRKRLVEEDLVECVIGLGPNLFYNSPMEACLLITKTNKSENKKGKVLFINAVKEVKQDKNIAFLEQQHIDKIYTIYKNFSEESEIAKIVSNEKLLENYY